MLLKCWDNNIGNVLASVRACKLLKPNKDTLVTKLVSNEVRNNPVGRVSI
jgi:hypothetical protein